MILEVHPLLCDAAQLGEGKDLKATAVREDRAIPAHEPVQSSQLLDHLFTRTHMEVVGITQDDAGAHGAKLVRGDGLYRGLRADRHEDWRLDITAARM